MKRLILFILLFILVMTISVIAHAPASFALKYMPVIRGLMIESPSGTIWHGEAKNVRWKGNNIGQVRWQFSPKKLLEGKANYHVRFGKGSDFKAMGKGNVGYGLSGLFADNIVLSMPAENVLQQLNLPLPMNVEGLVELSISDYHYAQPWCQSASGTLVWNSSKIASPVGELDLGSLITDLTCEDSKIMLTGEHDNQQISAAVDMVLENNLRYKANAWFKPNAYFPAEMKSQLKWLGDPNNKGQYTFTYAGRVN